MSHSLAAVADSVFGVAIHRTATPANALNESGLTNLDQPAYRGRMEQLNVYQAKTHFSEVLQRVERGEEIVVARAGRPIARIVPINRSRSPRAPGAWKGQVRLAPDFDELPPELAAAFLASE